MKFVTAFIDAYELHRSTYNETFVQKYIANAEKLILAFPCETEFVVFTDSETVHRAMDRFPNVDCHSARFSDFSVWNMVQSWYRDGFAETVNWQFPKETALYFAIQMYKFEALLHAFSFYEDENTFAWIDFGLYKMKGLVFPVAASMEFKDKQVDDPLILVTGNQDPFQVEEDEAAWRIATSGWRSLIVGGIFAWPRSRVSLLQTALDYALNLHDTPSHNYTEDLILYFLAWKHKPLVRRFGTSFELCLVTFTRAINKDPTLLPKT